jgi:ribonuclease VapC
MVVDSSALLAIMFNEPERSRFIEAIAGDLVRMVAAPTVLETAMVLAGRKGADPVFDIDETLEVLALRVVAFGSEEVREARRAHAAFGKGRHPARLNFGDCISYAVAKTTGEPLLYKGDDFSQTDIEAAA